MTEAIGDLFAAPVQQGAEQQHQSAIDQQLADMRRLADKPRGGGAKIGANFDHNRRSPHLQ